jgi:altronate hydrolase
MTVEMEFKRTVLRLHADDPVGVALLDLDEGLALTQEDQPALQVRAAVPAGHKLALRDIPQGEDVLRYGRRIGSALTAIWAGEHVHTHNLGAGAIGAESGWRLVPPLMPNPSGRTFLGYRRADGRAGSRNYIAVIATVNCSAQAAAQIARAFGPERLAAYPNVDGVVAVLHSSGCSIPEHGLSLTYLRRVLSQLGQHPNVAAALYVGLGCEVNQWEGCQPALRAGDLVDGQSRALVIQEQGGFAATLRAGIQAVEDLLPVANRSQREPVALAELCLGLECGGSDSWSGVTANPLCGRISDALVKEGGTAVLSETPEIFGAERLLLDRVVSAAVGDKLAQRFAWWLDQAGRRGFSIDNNPSPGNKAGGLTTILEKSLGAAAKGGSTPLAAVYEYAERIESGGFVFMDTPGNDPVSMTGMLAGGCNLALFTTGRGTPVGSLLMPTLKIASHSSMARRLPDLIDYDAGRLLEGQNWEEAERELLDLVVACASGKKTLAELRGSGEHDFVPWQPDLTL